MSDPSPKAQGRAVFISYASQDAEAARRIAESLRAVGVEVWFDQNELRGGDAWDQKIRRQIKECTLFIAVISKATQERLEGYFRREWRLGVERMADMDDSMPFLLPVSIDEVGESAVRVPERFYERQWTKLPDGNTPVEFADRVRRLVAGEAEHHAPRETFKEHVGEPLPESVANPVVEFFRKRQWALAVAGAAVVIAIIAIWRPWHSGSSPEEVASGQAGPDSRSGSPATPQIHSEASRLVERAREITRPLGLSRAQLDAAEALCEEALKLDPTSAGAWLEAARTDMLMIFPTEFDRSEIRRKQAQDRIARAVSLAPDSQDAQLLQAAVLAHAVETPALLDEAEKTIRKVLSTKLGDRELSIRLAEILRNKKRYADAGALFQQIGEFEFAGWSYFQAGNSTAALAAVQKSLDKERSVTALQLSAILQAKAIENLDAAKSAIDRILPSELMAERPASVALKVAVFRREPDLILQIAKALPRDFMDSSEFRGPRQYFTGLAHEMAGRKEAADTDWKAGIAIVDEQLKKSPDDRDLLLMSAWLQAAVGDRRKADRQLARAQIVAGLRADSVDASNAGVYMRLGRTDPVIAWLTNTMKEKPAMWEAVHAEARFSPDFDRLRTNKKFDTALRDTMPAGAPPLSEFAGSDKKSFWDRF